MTPQEKAKDLYDKMLLSGDDNGNFVYYEVAINCALIAVEEIITSFDLYGNDLSGEMYYWQAVKLELERL